MPVKQLLVVGVVVMLVVSACGAPAAPATESAPTLEAATGDDATTTPGSMDDGATTDDATTDDATTGDAMMTEDAERPAWQQIALMDARTGETFTFADFAGKTVYVEPFATWCTNCRRQLGYVGQAREQLGDEVVFITLSVEPNIANETLAQYADAAGFEWTFAAMPPDMLRELAAIQGQTIANPPATPHFIIRADGSFTDLVTGIESPDALLSRIEAERG